MCTHMICTYVIDVPSRLPIHHKKAKYFYLNLNIYRNTHFYILDKSKKMFESYIRDRLNTLPKFKYISLTYELYQGSARKVDISNTCCIVDKYFCDALVQSHIIPDDDYKHVTEIKYCYGGVSPSNPFVRITLKGEVDDESNVDSDRN